MSVFISKKLVNWGCLFISMSIYQVPVPPRKKLFLRIPFTPQTATYVKNIMSVILWPTYHLKIHSYTCISGTPTTQEEATPQEPEVPVGAPKKGLKLSYDEYEQLANLSP